MSRDVHSCEFFLIRDVRMLQTGRVGWTHVGELQGCIHFKIGSSPSCFVLYAYILHT